MKFFCLCPVGIENFIIKEIENLLYKFNINIIEETKIEETKKLNLTFINKSNGLIFFEINNFEIFFSDIEKFEFIENLSKIRFCDGIFILLKKYSSITRYKSSLRNIRHQTNKISKKLLEFVISYEKYKAKKFEKKINIKKNTLEKKNQKQILDVKASYIGKRDYNAIEVEKILKNIIINFLKSFLKSFQELKNINLRFHCFLREDFSLLGFEITELFFIEQTTGSLNKAIAELMLEIADVKKIKTKTEIIREKIKEENEKILDPMCGTGIIPLLCSVYGYEAYGNDIDKEKIKIGEKNKNYLQEIKKKEMNIEFTNNDALNLKFQDNYFSKIICNLPFGKEIQFKSENKAILSDEEKKEFYYKFFKEMIRISKKDAVFVFLTRDLDIITKVLEKINLKISFLLNIEHSGLKIFIIKIHLIKYLK